MFLISSPLDVSFDFFFELLSLFEVAFLMENSLSHFNDFKLQSDSPLSKELKIFILFVECWSEKLLSPIGLVKFLGSVPDVSGVLILDNRLIVASQVEGPDVVFVESMINEWSV